MADDNDNQNFQMAGSADDNRLPEDNDRPFAPPSDPDDSQYAQHQSTDDDLDETELYNEGIAGAAEQERPDNGAVNSYDPSAAKTEDPS